MNQDKFVIIAYWPGSLLRWDGNYGWVLIQPNEAFRAGFGHGYKTRAAAEAALGRMLKKYGRQRRLIAARVYAFNDLWVGEQFQLELITKGSNNEENA